MNLLCVWLRLEKLPCLGNAKCPASWDCNFFLYWPWEVPWYKYTVTESAFCDVTPHLTSRAFDTGRQRSSRWVGDQGFTKTDTELHQSRIRWSARKRRTGMDHKSIPSIQMASDPIWNHLESIMNHDLWIYLYSADKLAGSNSTSTKYWKWRLEIETVVRRSPGTEHGPKVAPARPGRVPSKGRSPQWKVVWLQIGKSYDNNRCNVITHYIII